MLTLYDITFQRLYFSSIDSLTLEADFEAVDGKIIPRDTYLMSWRQHRTMVSQPMTAVVEDYSSLDPIEFWISRIKIRK